MADVQNVVVERGLLRVVARQLSTTVAGLATTETRYDVEIRGQEILHSFVSLDEATQFLDMVAPRDGR